MSEEKKQTEEKPKDEKEKTIVVTVIVTLLAVAIIGGLIFVAKKYSDRKKELQTLKEQMENLQKSPENSDGKATITNETGTTEASPTQTTTDEYSGWKTYTNGEIGYTLKYPADWAVKETDEYSPVREATVKYITIYTPGNKYFLHWGLKEKSAGFYISDRTGMGAGDIVAAGKITILGTEVAINNFVFKGKAKEVFYPSAGTTPTSDGKYEFTATLSYGSGSNWDANDLSSVPEKALAEKILKSVALTGKTVSSSTNCAQNFTSEEKLNKADWKTVSNAKNGYSLKYPKDWTITEKKDDYLQMGNAANGEYFEWRSGPMTGTDYMGYKEDSHKNITVGCQSAKITYFSGDPTADPPIDAKDRLILVQFEKNGVPHVIIFTYKYFGASISSDVTEQFDLILKTVEFSN